MHFIIVGLSHKTAPLEAREKLAVSENQIPGLLAHLISHEDIQEAMIVSTCNRVEICLVCEHSERGEKVAREILSNSSLLYKKVNGEAIAHLFRVTAGLDSLVVGEPQITGQIKEAYSQAVAAQTTGPTLNKLVHKAFHVSKKIRTETGIGELPVSVSYVAVLLAEKIFGNLTGTGVLLLGAGEMGTLAARHLAERKVREIWISNRTGEKAISLANELGAKTVPFERFSEKFENVDIVISSLHTDQAVIHAAQVREAMKRRKNRPMFFIDIAVPRNIDSEVNQIQNVYLYDMDHLQEIVNSNLCEREKEAVKAEEIIGQEVAEFTRYLHQRDLSPTIEQLSKKFDRIRTAELEKYILKRSHLPEPDRQAIEACTKAIVNKILHEPILLMKTEEAKEGGMKYSEILKKLFGLE